MTDWSAIIEHLELHMRHIDIGAECGMSESWAGRVKRGVTRKVDADVAKRLLNLAARHGYVSRETSDVTDGG